MTQDSRFSFLAVLWSGAKVLAVTAVICCAVYAAVYFSPLDHTPIGPKAAITGIVFGLMGAAYWWARYFPTFKEQAERARKT